MRRTSRASSTTTTRRTSCTSSTAGACGSRSAASPGTLAKAASSMSNRRRPASSRTHSTRRQCSSSSAAATATSSATATWSTRPTSRAAPRSASLRALASRDSSAELFVERHERKLEGLDGARIGDDVVAELEHRQLVARHRRARKPLREGRLSSQNADGHVDRGTPRAHGALEPVPEVVPRHRVGAADLEHATCRSRLIDRACEVLGDVLNPDRLQAGRPVTDDRRDGCEARKPDERRERAAVLPEDEARPEDDVAEARRPHRALHLPLRGEVRDSVARALVEAERAREDEAAHTGPLCGGHEVARPVLHHALEVGARPLDDRDKVDHRLDTHAGGPQNRGIGDVADDELDPPRLEPSCPATVANDRTHMHVACAQRVHDVTADEPCSPRYENRRQSLAMPTVRGGDGLSGAAAQLSKFL